MGKITRTEDNADEFESPHDYAAEAPRPVVTQSPAEGWYRGGPFDAPPHCPICGRSGSHYHTPEAVNSLRNGEEK